MRWMGVLFAIFLIIAFGLVFNAVQANSIAQAAVRQHLISIHYMWYWTGGDERLYYFGGLHVGLRVLLSWLYPLWLSPIYY